MPGQRIAEIESGLARAHRAVHGCVAAASSLRDLGLHDDLQLILLELERLQFDLLRVNARRRAPLIVRTYL